MRKNRWFGIAILAATMLAATGLSLATEDPGPSARLIPSSRVTPVYPPAAFAARFDGEVTLSALVRSDGTVGEIEVLESSRPKCGFEQASMDAVAKWQFEPAELDGQAVDSYAVFRLSFGVDRGRNSQQAVVGGTMMPGGVSTDPSGAASATTAKGASPASGNSTASARKVQKGIAKIQMPPDCEGCIYNRKDLFPPKSDPPSYPR